MNWPSLSIFASKSAPLCKGKLAEWTAASDRVHVILPNRIVVLSQVDLDEETALQILDCKVKAVIHCGRVMSGYTPTQGPLLLLQHDIPIWEIEPEYHHLCVSDTDVILHKDYMLIGEHQIACRWYGKEAWLLDQQAANEHAVNRQEHFVEQTLAHAMNRKQALFKPLPNVMLRTKFEGRSVLIVSNGQGYKSELEAASRMLSRLKPVLVGVGEGADILLASGLTPDIVIAKYQQLSEQVRHCGAEIVIHTSSMDQELIDQPRYWSNSMLQELSYEGYTEDAALRLAYEQGGEWLITVGVKLHMNEFVAVGLPDMGSSLLVRLQLGERVVDMKSLSVLQASAQLPRRELVSTLILCGVFIGLSFFQMHWILKRTAHTVWKLVGL